MFRGKRWLVVAVCMLIILLAAGQAAAAGDFEFEVSPGAEDDNINLAKTFVLPIVVYSTDSFNALEYTYLFEGVAPVDTAEVDPNGDGLKDQMLYFERADFEGVLEKGKAQVLTMTVVEEELSATGSFDVCPGK